MTDSAALEFGAWYEFSLGNSDDEITLNTPLGSSNIDGSMDPSGFIFFVSISYYLGG
ncbi:MAG TPA: hypothetical protein QF764_16120 [Planctomycetota bacterium]|nr:hypothetical protein [Planctomycetota bacterium]